jgi:hypothetical protein
LVLRHDRTARFVDSKREVVYKLGRRLEGGPPYYERIPNGTRRSERLTPDLEKHRGPIFLGGVRESAKKKTWKYHAVLSGTEAKDLHAQARRHPVRIPRLESGAGARGPVDAAYWKYKTDYYATSELDLDTADVLALLTEAENKRRLKLEKAHALMAMREQLDEGAKRQPIPQAVKVAVWQRDKGRCVECESQTELEYDHIIPLALGGANTERNLQLLCAACNRRKGATLG